MGFESPESQNGLAGFQLHRFQANQLEKARLAIVLGLEIKTRIHHGQKKARLGNPPGSHKARFLRNHLALPDSVDFPPEINGESLSARLLS